MLKRAMVGVFGAAALIVVGTSSALAQGASWDGTWAGTTERGGSVQFTIKGGSPASYVFQGQSVPITGASASKNTITININGGIPGTVKLTRGKGNTVSYSYSDTNGGNAAATLAKQ